MQRNQIAELVVVALADQTGFHASDVTLDMKVTDDLGLDSLDAVELLVVLEREAGLVLELDEEVGNLVTVGDVVDWLTAVAPAELMRPHPAAQAEVPP